MNAPRSSAHGPPEPRTRYNRRRLGSTRAAMIGAAILVLGLAASAFVAAEWHSSLQRADRKSFSSTAAYLSSNGEAFTSRTAGYIIQPHFPPGIANTAPGPLTGVLALGDQ